MKVLVATEKPFAPAAVNEIKKVINELTSVKENQINKLLGKKIKIKANHNV